MAGLNRQFRVTHPFHPLHGSEFDLIGYRRSWGREYVEFDVGGGELRSIPLAWTNAAGADPSRVIGEGRSFFRVKDLIELVGVIEGLR